MGWMPSAAECPAGPPAMRKGPCPPPMCIPQSYKLADATCYNWCPMPAPKDQVPCPAMTNLDKMTRIFLGGRDGRGARGGNGEAHAEPPRGLATDSEALRTRPWGPSRGRP